MKKTKKIIFTSLTTILILFFIYREVNFNLLLQEVSNINLIWFIIAYTFLLSTMFVLAYKWKILISDYQKLDFLESVKLHFVMSTLSIITPLDAGEFINGFYKNDKKFNRKIGLGASIFEKLIDVLIISIIALFSINYFIEQREIFYFILLLVLFLISLIFILLTNSKKKSLLIKIINYLLPFQKAKDSIEELISYFNTIRKQPKKIIFASFLSLINWSILIIQGLLIFKVLNININPILGIRVISIGIVIAMIPITVSGFGTRDATFILLLSNYINYESIVLFGILFSLRYILLSLIGLIWLNEITKEVNIRLKRNNVK